MVKNQYPLPAVEDLQQLDTPSYLYNLTLLNDTLDGLQNLASQYGFEVHYAIKANANPVIMQTISKKGFGADCVSGGEIEAALASGFPAQKVVYAGVGKADHEINLGLDNDIFCFNVESLPELRIIDDLAKQKGKIAPIALRINPDVPAETHHYITTGLKENKFGINLDKLSEVLDVMRTLENIRFEGLHFHIGSQLLDMADFKGLCIRVNEIQKRFRDLRIFPKHLNLGGGLGINYRHPQEKPVADFENYFEVFHKYLDRHDQQTIHFELGRSIVGNCGFLLSKALYVKEGSVKQYAILDAGMTDLIRPALYQAYHKIENISSQAKAEKYDVVGPVCETSDCFAKEIYLNKVSRGDSIIIYSAGAYGEVMASRYNCRQLPKSYFFENGKIFE